MSMKQKTLRQTGAHSLCLLNVLMLGLASGLRAEANEGSTAQNSAQPPFVDGLTRMPVREITVFKDGHAFVLHEGAMATNEHGEVVLDYLPAPVIGTFWPYSSDPMVKLTGVKASTAEVTRERMALNLRELLEANAGADVLIAEADGTYTATLLGIPARKPASPAPSGPSGEPVPEERGDVVLLRTLSGVKVIDIGRIRDVTFLSEPRRTRPVHEFRDLMTLKLDWAGAAPRETASVGLVYLQKGIRWIPSYRVTIDGQGKAVIQLQATLLNELADLDDVTAHLVIGVPTFAFEETIDPISLQRAAAQLSSYFQTNMRTAQAFSNAIMTQSVRASEHRAPVWQDTHGATDAGTDETSDWRDAGRSEDLFIFTIEHITLKKGERMVLPVREFNIEYKDVYELELPLAPLPEIRQSFGNQRDAELVRLFAAPKVMHALRLYNNSAYPLTTGPALVLHGDRLLAQGIMTYTAAGGSSDLAVTAAVDVHVGKAEQEVDRDPAAAQWQNQSYTRINLAGVLKLTNYRDDPISLEVVRHVLGNVDSADNEGRIRKVSVYEDSVGSGHGGRPDWWGWYNWPHWWHHFNGIGRIDWNLTLEPGKQIDLAYTWHYYWR